MKCAKMAEPINVPFGMWTWVGPTSHALGGGPDFPRGRSSWGAFPGIVAFRYNSLTTRSLTQLVGRQEGHPAYKKTVSCLFWLEPGFRVIATVIRLLLSGGVLAWLSVWSEVQTCIWPS